MRKLKKSLLVFAITAFIVVVVAILFISPIAKYLIEKYDEKYTGRRITLDWAYVNPFTGHIHLHNLKIYEHKSDSLFLTADGLTIDFGMLRFLRQGFEIKKLTLDHPVIKVIRDQKRLNFEDVIEKFSSGDTVPKKPSTTKVDLLDLKITNAEIHYTDRQIPFDYFIKEGNFETSGKHWYEDTMAIRYSFLSGPSKGSMRGEFHVNFKTSDYLLADKIGLFDLKPLEQYVKDLAYYGSVRAELEADLLAKGNFHDAKDLIASGTISVVDFHLGRKPSDDYMAFDRLKLVITELSPINRKYLFDQVTLTHPFVKYERYDQTDNLSAMFAKKGAGSAGDKANLGKLNILVAIGRYIKSLSTDFFRSDYKINNLSISRGDLLYNDYSLSEEFSTGLQGLSITADSINKRQSRANIFLKSGLQPYGAISIHLSIDPNDSSYFDIGYQILGVPASLFNPYTITYTSFPLDRGTVELEGAWHVLGGSIRSNNHLVIVDPRPTRRIHGKDKKWIPLPLIFAFIRERGDVIDYEIPVTGSLKDPRFHFHDVAMHLLENIFVKPATTAYRFEVRNTEKVIEKSLQVKWPLMGSTLLPSQDKFLSETAEFMAKNKNADLKIAPFEYTAREKEYLAFFEAKKKYLLSTRHQDAASFSSADSIKAFQLSVRDKDFTSYLTRHVRDTLLFTLEEKCIALVGTKLINERLGQLEKSRNEAFAAYFKRQQVADRLKMLAKKSSVPFDGFSYHEIGYDGPLPDQLIKAYQKINELNAELPRKKYRKEHKKALL
jgi:uncharacterized protein DUF748